MTPEVCPNCGADVPRRAKACPECGADEKTGWSEEAESADLGLPEENFDYDEFVKREFSPVQKQRPRIGWVFWLAAVLVALALLGIFAR